jgi:hypothetical protein
MKTLLLQSNDDIRQMRCNEQGPFLSPGGLWPIRK